MTVGLAGDSPELSEIETRFVYCPQDDGEVRKRLVLIHPDDQDRPRGTARWLRAFRLESATKSLETDFCLGKTTSDFLRFWPRADAYLQEKDVELKGYKSSVRSCPATFEGLKRFLGSLDTVAS